MRYIRIKHEMPSPGMKYLRNFGKGIYVGPVSQHKKERIYADKSVVHIRRPLGANIRSDRKYHCLIFSSKE